jgi:hypothetical protein
MKLNVIIDYINQALNFPNISYKDVSVYFDSAISELNTSLHIDMPLVSTMIADYRHFLAKTIKNKIHIPVSDIETPIPVYDTEPSGNNIPIYYYNSAQRVYGVLKYGTYIYFYKLYAVSNPNGVITYYNTYNPGDNEPIWLESELNEFQFEMSNYMPDDWVLLWLVPYVCFKYTVRDGGTASVFADELNQGFQQLQDTYNVPEKTNLIGVAGKYAYTDIVKRCLPMLNVKVPTKAIYPYMKHDRAVSAIYGSEYDTGGFGI